MNKSKRIDENQDRIVRLETELENLKGLIGTLTDRAESAERFAGLRWGLIDHSPLWCQTYGHTLTDLGRRNIDLQSHTEAHLGLEWQESPAKAEYVKKGKK